MQFSFFRPSLSHSTPLPGPSRRAVRKSTRAGLLNAPAFLIAVFLIVAALLISVWPVESAASPGELSGTYRIEGWRGMEKRGLHHFFYLHPGGYFLLGAAWPGHETSRFVGTWSAAGGRVTLKGKGKVETNQGNWTVAFLRTYRISEEKGGLRLAPIPEKNRFGLMGWPNAFRRHSEGPAPNLPGAAIPAGEVEILRYIKKLLEK